MPRRQPFDTNCRTDYRVRPLPCLLGKGVIVSQSPANENQFRNLVIRFQEAFVTFRAGGKRMRRTDGAFHIAFPNVMPGLLCSAQFCESDSWGKEVNEPTEQGAFANLLQ